MQTATELDPANVLTASELIFLNGEQFAKKVMIGNIDLLHSAEKVSAAELGQAMVVSAFLSSERAGAIRLEVREKKVLLGLRKAKGLYAAPATAIEWPDYSREAQIGSIAADLAAEKGANEVANIVYAWLREDSGSPWQAAIE